MESEGGADSNDGAASTEKIDHWGDELGTEGKQKIPEYFGDQEEEASKERLTPKYFFDKATQRAEVWTWFGGVAGPAWLVLVIILMIGLLIC